MERSENQVNQTFSVNTPSSNYPVFVDHNILGQAGKILVQQNIKGPVYVISDQKVWSLHGEELVTSLNNSNIQSHVFTFLPGEESKNLSTTNDIYNWLATNHCERGNTLLGLGGGVVGDITGFVASPFLRGIPFIQLPTSLSAMVDASIGGKTGVNLSAGKNLVGAFYQPALVAADLNTLKTLSRRELASGWAEAIRHGLILDVELFNTFEHRSKDLLSLEPDIIREVVAKSMAIKGAIVGEDEKETVGKRTLLNYGHTIGHGLEMATGYSSFLHGEAVSIGMIAAGLIGKEMGLIDQQDLDRYTKVLTSYGLPISSPGVDSEIVLNAMKMDKKVTDKKINWVLLESIGKAITCSNVDEELVRKIVNRLCA